MAVAWTSVGAGRHTTGLSSTPPAHRIPLYACYPPASPTFVDNTHDRNNQIPSGKIISKKKKKNKQKKKKKKEERVPPLRFEIKVRSNGLEYFQYL